MAKIQPTVEQKAASMAKSRATRDRNREARRNGGESVARKTRLTRSRRLLPTMTLPPELWTMVGQLIHSKETFRALILVCKEFRDLFTPFLFSQAELKLNSFTPQDLQEQGLPRGIQNTKTFALKINEFLRFKYNISMNKDYAIHIANMIQAMPALQSFSFYNLTGLTGDTVYHPPLILRDMKLLQALKASKNLKNLSITWDCDLIAGQVSPTARNCFIPLGGFRNLTSLELYDFYGMMPRLACDIAGLLVKCPALKKLGLGRAVPYDCYDLETPTAVILDEDDEENKFLENLSKAYESHPEQGGPLKLDTLRLGRGLYLFDSVTPGNASFLEKLVCLPTLDTLELYNGLTKWKDDDSNMKRMNICWDLLGECKALRRVSLARIQPDVIEWLNTTGVQELIVTDNYMMFDRELSLYEKLQLPKLTMIHICEREDMQYTEDYLFDSDDDQEDSESDLDDDDEDSELEAIEKWRRPGPLPEEVTILDRLGDGGIHLTTLALCLNLEVQWEHFSFKLAKLTQLTQICINRRFAKPGRWPPKASSLWPGIEKPDEIVVKYAELLTKICPSLQYIRIHQWAWQLMRIWDPVSLTTKAQLRRMDSDEILSIEFFAIDNTNTICGLPGIEDNIAPVTEEDHLRWEAMEAAYMAHIGYMHGGDSDLDSDDMDIDSEDDPWW